MAEATVAEPAPAAPLRFVFPHIHDNPSGWGPCEVPEQFRDTPYQPFCKDDRLGKVADWTGNLYQDKRAVNKYGNVYGAGGQSQTYVYRHEQDESTFQLVDTSRPQRPMYRRRPMQGRGYRRDKDRKDAKKGGRQPFQKNKTQERRSKHRKFFRSYHYDNPPSLKPRLPSVDIKASWKVMREVTFPELAKLNFAPEKPQNLYLCGAVGYYDGRKEKSVSVKFPQKLAKFDRVFHTVSTSNDPIFRKLARSPECSDCKVFATDAILATLMTMTRSKYSWDIVVHRVGDYVFFDKRDDSRFDYLTVSETAKQPPQDEAGINSPQSLAVEATYINQNFSQQMLMYGRFHRLKHPNPFIEDESEEIASVAYRYRKFYLKDGVGMVVRCKYDAVMPPSDPKGEPDAFINIKALNEWDPKHSGGNHVDWRKNLDRQRGAVFATELKNNSCKIAKWVLAAMLGGSSIFKCGFISRQYSKDSSKHEILGIRQERPEQFAQQLNLDVGNAWGILHAIIDYCRELELGKYLILKDANNPVVRIYSVSEEEFESEESGSESDGSADEKGSE